MNAMHPIALTISTGRCGTTFLEKTFKENFKDNYNWISHEYLRQNITNVGTFHRCYTEACQREMLNEEINKFLKNVKPFLPAGPL
jgi:hypothetical protein